MPLHLYRKSLIASSDEVDAAPGHGNRISHYSYKFLRPECSSCFFCCVDTDYFDGSAAFIL